MRDDRAYVNLPGGGETSELYINWNDNSYDKAYDSLKPK
jgi:hypothetical protein